MGKREKKQKHQRHPRRELSHYLLEEPEEEGIFNQETLSLSPKPSPSESEREVDDQPEEVNEEVPSKFLLYQQSVQSPKGDISYLQKFFLMYVGGRQPLHLQEDFCGTALVSGGVRGNVAEDSVGLVCSRSVIVSSIESVALTPIGIDGSSMLENTNAESLSSSAVMTVVVGVVRKLGGSMLEELEVFVMRSILYIRKWLRSDPRRTAVGLDLDIEALNWCIKNNVSKFGSDESSRISLFHGNVLQPFEAMLVSLEPQELIRTIVISDQQASSEAGEVESDRKADLTASAEAHFLKTNLKQISGRDIVCAFNYSCCCLHKRGDLLLYFKNVRSAISSKGGIFVMDLYGGTSSEQKLRLQRRFPNFTYIWEQAEFDILERKTRISLHYHLRKPQKKIRHAFSYSWRLWSLPEVKECLEEAGFHSVHFWLRQMPDSDDIRSVEGFGMGRDVKYEEVESFLQQDSWNAYVVAVAR